MPGQHFKRRQSFCRHQRYEYESINVVEVRKLQLRFISPVYKSYCFMYGGDKEPEALWAAMALGALLSVIVLGLMWSV